MLEEQAFLKILDANPCDDTTRLVYADWLDERGHAQHAAYLRALVDLTTLPPGCEEYTEAAARLFVAVPQVSDEWLYAVGRRFDLFVRGYSPASKISFIKIVREQAGLGLAEAKALSESCPTAIFSWCRYEELFSRLLQYETQTVYGPATADVIIRPSPWPVTGNDMVCDIVLTRIADERDNQFHWPPPFPPAHWVDSFEYRLARQLGHRVRVPALVLPMVLATGLAPKDVAAELRRIQLQLNVYRVIPHDGFQIVSRPKE
jgi:uncharacterized protein (TIGR02996 family)